MPKTSTATLVLALLSAAAIFGLSFAGARMGAVSREAAETKSVTVEDDIKSIAIPGYEAIPLKAGQNEQSVSFYNPARNDCYFVVSLILTGEELFSSEPIAPGEELHNIYLAQPLAAGVYYDVRLRYRSFDLNSMEELNGAEVVTILEVKSRKSN